MRIPFFFLLVALGTYGFFDVRAAASELSIQDIWHKAYTTNPQLQAARFSLQSVRENLPQAQAGWRPTVSSAVDILHTDSDSTNFGGVSGSTSKALSLSFDQPLYRGGRTVAGVAGARATIKARELEVFEQAQDILLQVTTAYMDIVRDQELVELQRQNQSLMAQELEEAQARFESGMLTVTDVSQAKARLSMAIADAVAAAGTLENSRAAFEALTALPAADLTDRPFVSPPLPQSLEAFLAHVDTHNPNILSARHAYEAAENDVDGVFGELLPALNAYGAYERVYDPQPGILDKQTTKSIGVTASIPLYQAGAVRSRVRGAKYTANQRYMHILDTQRRARQDAISAWHDWHTALSQIESRAAQVEAASVAQQGVDYESESGLRTILEVLDADLEVRDARAALIGVRRDEVVARFTMLKSMGMLSPDVLGFDKK